MPQIRAALAVPLLLMPVLVGCGSDPVEVPDVVGMRLDDAKDALTAAGFEETSAEDVVGNSSPFRTSTWAVLEQEPAAGQRVDLDTKIRLGSGPLDKAATKEGLPADSPAMALILAAERKSADEQARKDVEDRADAERKAA